MDGPGHRQPQTCLGNSFKKVLAGLSRIKNSRRAAAPSPLNSVIEGVIEDVTDLSMGTGPARGVEKTASNFKKLLLSRLAYFVAHQVGAAPEGG